MPDIKGLFSDPRFQSMDLATQRSTLAHINPSFANLSDGDFHEFRTRLTAPGVPPAPIPPELTMNMQPGFMESMGHAITSGPLNPMNWPSMVASGFEDPFSDANMAEAHKQADLMSGKTKPDPIYTSEIPGMAGDLVGQGINAGAMYGLSELPGSRVGAGVSGALKGGTKAALKPVEMGKFKTPVPASVAGGLSGAASGGAATFFGGHGKLGSIVGGVSGTAAPFVGGAIEGGRQALKDYDFTQALRNRPAPVYSAGPSMMPPDVVQYGQGGRPVQPPVEVGKPVELGGMRRMSGPTSGRTPVDVPFAGVSPEDMATRLPDVTLPDWYGSTKKVAAPKVSAPAAAPAAPVTTATPSTTPTILPDAVTPPGAPAATNGGYAFTHPTGSMTDLRKQLFATGQEMDLPGSPAKTRATQQIRDSSMDLFGKSVSNLEHGELFKLNEFLAKHKRLPTKADLDLLGK